MRVTVKLFANLREGRLVQEKKEFPPGATVANVLGALGIREGQVMLHFVNGRHAEPSTELAEGDVVALFPPVGGG